MNVVVFGAAGWLGRAILSGFENRHTIRAFDIGPAAWAALAATDGLWRGETVHGDIAHYPDVERAVEGMDGVVHAAVHAGSYDVNDTEPFLVNLKGLWNVLEAARRKGMKRVVHIGSCQTEHPDGIFFTSEVRRPDGSLYAVTKRLQEEMCRQFYDAFRLSIIVLRPDYIVDSRLGVGKGGVRLGPPGYPIRNGCVCRHDLAEACHLALTTRNVDFDILHVVGTPEADETCNVKRTRDLLGLSFNADLDPYRKG